MQILSIALNDKKISEIKAFEMLKSINKKVENIDQQSLQNDLKI